MKRSSPRARYGAVRLDSPDLSGALASEMAAFRASHPHQRAVIFGHAWSYISCGEGPEAIVILPGAHGFAEAAFRYVTALEPYYRVITPNYPAEAVTLADLADGVALLMEHEGVQQAHVLGGSFGSLVAQALVQRHPERILSVMLEHALFPRRRIGVLIVPLKMMARTLPTQVLRILLRLAVAPFQWQIARGRAFWVSYFHRAIASFSRQDILARLSVLEDFHAHGRASLAKLKDWSGRMLVVASEMDSLMTPQDRKDLLSHYSEAEVEVLAGGSHMGAVEEPERYIALYTRFLGVSAEDQWTSI
jgi:pimeloyl-ACP methyl ester carboxylesterase